MRFYALFAAFAALLINHALASEAIDFVEKILKDTKKDLEDYKYHLKNLQRYYEDNYEVRKKNATESVEASVRELSKVFEEAQKKGKIANDCRNPLTTISNRALTKHIDRLNTCIDTNLPNFEAGVRKTSELMTKGEIYQTQLKNIQKSCKNETTFMACVVGRARELHGSVLIWRDQMTKMKRTATRAISNAKKQLPVCITPSVNRFKLELTAANRIARMCVAALPGKKSD